MKHTIKLKENEFKAFLKKIIKETISKSTCKYPVINEAKSAFGAFKVDRLGDIKATQEKCVLSEGIDWEVEEEKRGGVIVFSTDVNAIELHPNKIVNFIKQKFASLKQRMCSTKIIDKVSNENELIGWTIGHYLDGRYRAKNGKNFGEKSLSLELVGIDDSKLISVAEDICRAFKQECVLVKSYSTGKIFFVNPT